MKPDVEFRSITHFSIIELPSEKEVILRYIHEEITEDEAISAVTKE